LTAHRGEIGEVFAGVHKENRHLAAAVGKSLEKCRFLEPVGFPAQPLDAIAVNGPFKLAAADAKTRLERRFRLRSREKPIDFIGKERQALSFPKKPLYLFAAL
jgi:hypothetical protein